MKRNKFVFWLFLFPSLFAFLLVLIIPAVEGFVYSFTDWKGIRVDNLSFIGFKNYQAVFKDKIFWHSFLFTTLFTIVSVIILNFMGFFLAILVTKTVGAISNLFRTIFFMPNLIGGLILGFIWQFIFIKFFSAMGNSLHLNFLKGWLSDTNTGFWGLVILMSWQMSGYIMIVYIAVIENIPNELNEASFIDGATSFQQIKHITFPLSAPAFTVSLFLTISNSFKLFDQNLSLTKGDPGRHTEMIAMNIYNTAFSFQEIGQAQAKAVILFITIAVVTIIQVSLSKKREIEA